MPEHTHRRTACKFEQMRSYHYSPFSLLRSLEAIARDSSRELHSTVAQILMLTGLLTQTSPCAKLHNNRPSVSEWNASNKQDRLCAGLNENTTSEDTDCAIYKGRKYMREITLNCTERWRESALEDSRSLGKQCLKDTLERICINILHRASERLCGQVFHGVRVSNVSSTSQVVKPSLLLYHFMYQYPRLEHKVTTFVMN